MLLLARLYATVIRKHVLVVSGAVFVVAVFVIVAAVVQLPM